MISAGCDYGNERNGIKIWLEAKVPSDILKGVRTGFLYIEDMSFVYIFNHDIFKKKCRFFLFICLLHRYCTLCILRQ